MGDIAAQERDIRQAIARASLRQDWEIAEANPITDEEIEQEIQAARAELSSRGERRVEGKKKIA
jgi:predicted PilT family ATPase